MSPSLKACSLGNVSKTFARRQLRIRGFGGLFRLERDELDLAPLRHGVIGGLRVVLGLDLLVRGQLTLAATVCGVMASTDTFLNSGAMNCVL